MGDGNPARSPLIAVTPVADAQDIDPLAVIVESHSPVAGAQAKLGRVDTVKSLDITGAGGRETVDGFDDGQRDSGCPVS